MLTWCMIPDAGQHHREVLERLLSPPQEPIPFAVAGVLDLHVPHQRASLRPKTSAMTEWSMTSSAGTRGFTMAQAPCTDPSPW